jgi:hypothetical protein
MVYGGARRRNGASLPPYTRSQDPKIGPTSIYQTVSVGNSVNKSRGCLEREREKAGSSKLISRAGGCSNDPPLFGRVRILLAPKLFL